MVLPSYQASGSEFLAYAGEHPGAQQLDGPEKGGLGHAPHIHLKDLPRVPEESVQVKDAVGHLIGSAREHHSTRLKFVPPARGRPHRTTDLRALLVRLGVDGEVLP